MGAREDIRAALYAELDEAQAAERAAQGLELYPLATWHAFAPDQLAGVIIGVTRMDPAPATRLVHHLNSETTAYEFSTQRRDTSGVLIGGARWRIERDGISAYVLHLLQSEPCGVA